MVIFSMTQGYVDIIYSTLKIKNNLLIKSPAREKSSVAVPTFLLCELETGHLLAHGGEGKVVLCHRLLVLALQPGQ